MWISNIIARSSTSVITTRTTFGNECGLSMQQAPGTPLQYHTGLLEACPFPLLVIDSEGRITAHNTAALALTGRTGPELMNTVIYDHLSGNLTGTEIHRRIFTGTGTFEHPLLLRVKKNSYTDIRSEEHTSELQSHSFIS